MDKIKQTIMDKIKQTIKEYYNTEVVTEWERLLHHPVEYAITCRYIDRYIEPNTKVLDIGGGPGRYSLYLAEKGCDVTLIDLSDVNIAFAKERADEQHLLLNTICGDACVADSLVCDQYDHILLMGPLYHLPDEADRIKAINAAINLLKKGGLLFSAFISSYAAVWDFLVRIPENILDPEQEKYYALMSKDLDFSGISFTQSYCIRPQGVNKFMEQFPLDKLHLVGCESILALRNRELLQEPPEVLQKWIDFAVELCERESLLSMSHHFLHIGRKINENA